MSATPPLEVVSTVTGAPEVVGRRFRLPGAGAGLHVGRRLSWVIVGLLIAVTLLALFGRLLAPFDPVQPISGLNLPPGSPDNLLGTDSIGRDLLSRTLYGIQVSWFAALVVVASGLLVGGVIGTIAGVAGGWLDNLLMRLTDLFLALPGTLVAIAIVAALGFSLQNTLLGIAIVWWPYYARIIRGEVKSIASKPHVEAAKLAGTSRTRIVFRHIIPGMIPTAIVTASLDIGNVVLLLAGLSFLGLGQPAPAPELGADTARNLGQLLTSPWIPIIPGLAVLLLSLVANLGGDAIRSLIGGRR